MKKILGVTQQIFLQMCLWLSCVKPLYAAVVKKNYGQLLHH